MTFPDPVHSEIIYGQAVARFFFHPNWCRQSLMSNTLESILSGSHGPKP
jgi:hypothetical protein